MVQELWKNTLAVSEKVKLNHSTQQFQIQELPPPQKKRNDLYMNVHDSIINNSPKVETTQS